MITLLFEFILLGLVGGLIGLFYRTSWEVLPAWQNIIIGVITAIGVQHLVVLDVSKYLMNKHPDFDNEI